MQRIACPEIDATIGAVRGYNLRDRDNRDARLGDNLASSPAYGAQLFELRSLHQRYAANSSPAHISGGAFFIHLSTPVRSY